ncbi:hypothetical protein [Methylobacterium sp. SI9]|uniref:hypothetical protein n=1 Tax=Methylobacterium guangdongense TaxID=3138811 RepID=UPI00313AC429
MRGLPRRAATFALAILAGAISTVGHAQVSEAITTAVTAGKAADTFLSRGEYGAIVVVLAVVIVVGASIAGAVIKFLYNENKALGARLEEIAERAVTGLNTVASANDRDREVLQGLRASLDTRAQALGELSNLVSVNGTKLEHGLAGVSQVMGSLVERFRELREDLLRNRGSSP